MRSRPVVTIDGPSGAGKTTVSKRLADAAGMIRVDTGAMYRAVALAARSLGVPWDDPVRLGGVARELELSFRVLSGVPRVLLSGVDVTLALREPEMSMGASAVSVHGPVRVALVAKQREMARDGGVVLEGRDIGTVVFPDAEAKFFLDAAAAVRARRRQLQISPPGAQSFEEVLRDVLRRDVQDSTREHSPLRVADDAVYIDSTTMTVDEVVGEMLRRLPGVPR
ncbi:(d)CMP kinase [Candidatus Deferrimicrobium sp.]|uniref:(d)CMP kinase n=1 Tax=Candidatus Deferrimicrobium sp. TaxID=3060586 RepID=UPI002ED88ED7